MGRRIAIQTHTETHGQKDSNTDTWAEGQQYRHMDRRTAIQTHGQKDSNTDTHRHMDRRIAIHTHTDTWAEG